MVFPSGQSQTHRDRTRIHGEDRTFALIRQKQKGWHGDDGQERGQCIPNWNGPKNKDHRKPIDAEGDPIIVAEDSIGDTSGAAPIVNGHFPNGGNHQ